MKAYLEIELIGDDVAQMCKLFANVTNEIAPGLGTFTFGGCPSSGWVAEITGADSKFKYKRTFLKRKKDYSRANSKGSRGIFAEYILESGKYYEVSSQTSWKGRDRYFCNVDEEGNIVRIDESKLTKAFDVPEKQKASFTYSKAIYYAALNMLIDGVPTEQQRSEILKRMSTGRDAIIKSLRMLMERIPIDDLIVSLETGRYRAGGGLSHMQAHLWGDMERAMTDYNFCADVAKMEKVTYKILLKGVRLWLKNRLESMFLQQPDSE